MGVFRIKEGVKGVVEESGVLDRDGGEDIWGFKVEILIGDLNREGILGSIIWRYI